MKTSPITLIRQLIPVLVLVLALLSCVGSAKNAAILDEQLIKAAAMGDSAEVIRLIEKGADPNANGKHGRRALTSAAGEGDLQMVRLLLDKGADVNVEDRDGWTPLRYAEESRVYRTRIVKLLKAHGAEQ